MSYARNAATKATMSSIYSNENEPRTDDQILPQVKGAPFGVQRSYDWCVELVGQRKENFPVASRMLPAPLRPHVAAVYAFARMADDFADELQFEGRRMQLLEAWESALFRCFHGEATHPVFVALKNTIDKYDIPVTTFRDLIEANRMDLQVTRYPTFNALLTYCEKSANPVGRILLSFVADQAPEHLRAADDISTALRLVAFLRSFDADFRRGRIYIPEEDLMRFSVSEADIRQCRMTRPMRQLVEFWVARTRMYLLRGAPLLDSAPSELRTELMLIWHGGNAVLDVLERSRFDLFDDKLRLTSVDWARAAGRVAMHRLRAVTEW